MVIKQQLGKLRAALAHPRAYIVWYHDRFAIFLTTEPIAEVRRRFIELGGTKDDTQLQTQHVRCREIPTLGHRLINHTSKMATGCLFVSWKVGASGKVYGWNTSDREDAVRWFIMGGGVS